MLIMSFSVMANSELILKFKNKKEKEEWIMWYLDGGGEDQSGYYVMTWNEMIFNLENDRFSKANRLLLSIGKIK
jgi:hypothetical protein